MHKPESIIAKTISVVLQPLLMPFYSILLLFAYSNYISSVQIFRILMPVLLFTFIIPSLFIFVLWKLEYISNLHLSEQYERIFPYSIFLVANISLTYFFYTAGIYYWFIGLIAVPAIIALVGMIINLFWKISAHMLGIGGLIGSTLSVCYNVKSINPFVLFIILFILAGSLASSRLYLAKNTPSQVYAGFIIGITLAYTSVSTGALSLFINL